MLLYRKAEFLTKDWLMGIRKGWLSLLKPNIEDWNDVFIAFDELIKFVNNLEESIKYVRPSLSSISPTAFESEKNQLYSLFRYLRKEIKENRDKARHWYNSAIDNIPFPSEEKRKDAERMLLIYKTKFEEVLTTEVKTNVGWNKNRPASITEILDKILKILRKNAKEIEKSRQTDPKVTAEIYGDSTYKEFDLYGMKIVIDDTTVNPQQIRQYVKFFDKAYHLLKDKGFSRIWHGIIFIKCENCGGPSQYGAEFNVAGNYPIGEDVINVFDRPGQFIVDLILHELGHRYWYKYMNEVQRSKFEKFVKIKSLGKDELSRKDIDDAVKKAQEMYQEARINLMNFVQKYEEDTTPDKFGNYIEAINGFDIFCRSMEKILGLAADLPIKKIILEKYLPKNKSYNPRDISREREDSEQYLKRLLNHYLKPTYILKNHKLIGDNWTNFIKKNNREEVLQNVSDYENKINEAEEQAGNLFRKLYDFIQEEPHVEPVSHYGGVAINEAFAEAFMKYVTESGMNRSQIDSFKAVIKKSKLNIEEVIKMSEAFYSLFKN